GHDLVAVAGVAHDDRLDDAVGLDRLGQALDGLIVEDAPRLARIRPHLADLELDHRRRAARELGDEGGEAAAEAAGTARLSHARPPRGPRGSRRPRRRRTSRTP